MKKLLLITLLLAAGLGLLAGCGDDDDPVVPEEFSFALTVVDPAGAPVPGVDLIILADLPYYLDGKAAAKARVAFNFDVAHQCDVQLIIEDLQDEAVYTFTENHVQVGTHRWVWNGRDQDEALVHSGVYHVRLIMRDSDDQEVLFDGREPVYLAKMDFDDDNMGTTDADGRIVLSDERLFPHVLDAADQEARNEDGEVVGPINFDGTMRFYLRKTGEGDMMHIREVDGVRELELVWDPRKLELAAGAGNVERTVVPLVVQRASGDLVPTVNRLYGPYPNPFN